MGHDQGDEERIGDMELQVVIEVLGGGHVVVRPALTEFRRLVELERIPELLSRTLADWLQRHSAIRVRATLPIVEDGFTVIVHVWFDGDV